VHAFKSSVGLQIDFVNEMQLLTAKPVTYLVNLSEKDFIRKKNKWYIVLTPYFRQCVVVKLLHSRLPKIKAWIDENNPGDPLIPFSVALEERLAQLPDDDARAEEEKDIGVTSNLGKITTAGYASLNVSELLHEPTLVPLRVLTRLAF